MHSPSPPAASSLVLLRHDLEAHNTHTTIFTDTSVKRVLFVGKHSIDLLGEVRSTTLYRGDTLLGKVSLPSVVLGSDVNKGDTKSFYRTPHCFSTKKLFKLSRDGPWVCWRQIGKNGPIRLVEYKSKKIIASVTVDKATGLSRLIVHSTTAASASPPSCAPADRTSLVPALPYHLPLPRRLSSTGGIIKVSKSSSSLVDPLLPFAAEKPSLPSAAKVDSVDTSTLAVILLTLLHRDLPHAEKARKEEREREEEEYEESEVGAW